MKKAKKITALLLCAVLLVVGSVTGTMAYLTSQDSVTNTFTVGKVAITLDEALVDEYGKPMRVDSGAKVYVTLVADADRVDANTYKLIPSNTYVKDPTIHVDPNSESCFVFVQIANAISAYEDTSATIASQITAKGWTQGTGTIPANVYYKEYVKGTTDKDLKVFDSFTIDKNANKVTGWDTIDGSETIVITAYAIQKDGLTVDAAWTALTTP